MCVCVCVCICACVCACVCVCVCQLCLPIFLSGWLIVYLCLSVCLCLSLSTLPLTHANRFYVWVQTLDKFFTVSVLCKLQSRMEDQEKWWINGMCLHSTVCDVSIHEWEKSHVQKKHDENREWFSNVHYDFATDAMMIDYYLFFLRSFVEAASNSFTFLCVFAIIIHYHSDNTVQG